MFGIPEPERGLSSITNKMAESGSAYHCCVPECNGDARLHTELIVHRFPKNTLLRKKWIHLIRRDEGSLFKITDCTRVCSRHFKEDDIKKGVFGPKRGKLLLPNTVPSQVTWSLLRKSRMNVKEKIRARLGATESTSTDTHESDDEPMDFDIEVVELSPDQEAMLNLSPKELILLLAAKQHEIDASTSQLETANTEIDRLQSANEQLKLQFTISRFGLQRYSTDNKLIKYYTGFTNYQTLLAFFLHIRIMATSMQTVYYVASQDVTQAGRKSCMPLEDELFMFLCRLWSGLQEQDLADRFHCSLSTVSRKIITWANLLYFILGSMNMWLPRNCIKNKLPSTFKNTKYEHTRVIIDCTELKIQMPSSLVLNSQTYSSYKSSNTLKCLIGIAPHGAVTFVSSLYTGCMSDVEITRLCGLLDLLEEDDVVMADKGFTIQKDCEARKASLNIPPFLRQNAQFTPSDVAETQEIATLRIHVERAIQRAKDNNLFKVVLPLNIIGSVSQLWTVAVLLTNFQGPLIIEK